MECGLSLLEANGRTNNQRSARQNAWYSEFWDTSGPEILGSNIQDDQVWPVHQGGQDAILTGVGQYWMIIGVLQKAAVQAADRLFVFDNQDLWAHYP